VDWIDRLNVEDVLRVLTSTNVKVCIVLKGETDQIRDRVLRGLAQGFTLLDMRGHCGHEQDGGRTNDKYPGCDAEAASPPGPTHLKIS
jgi:hypothetical protein